jgi:hypothetical protein
MRVVGLDGNFPADQPGLAFGATGIADDWASVRLILLEAFRLTQQAVGANEPVVYVVSNDDLLGRNGPGSAAVACGLVSAARTAATELSGRGIGVNVLAIDEDAEAELVVSWVVQLAARGGVHGELIHLGPGHLGKALS